MTPELTTKEKISLNRRAKAHGLPCLWPEAEATMEALFRDLAHKKNEEMRLLGLGCHPGIPSTAMQAGGLPHPRGAAYYPGPGVVPGICGWIETPWHREPLFFDEVYKPPPSPSLWARARAWLRRRIR